MSFYVEVPETWPRQYRAVDQAPAKGYRYASAPPFIVHSKLGGSFKKPQPFVVRGVGRDELLVQKIGDFAEPDCHENYKALYADGSWHTINFDYTTEGYRFVRTVRKAIELLAKLSREALKAQAKAKKVQKDFDDRGARCGICPCCFGDYVDFAADQVLQILLDGHDVEDGPPWLQIYQYIDVAVRPSLSPRG